MALREAVVAGQFYPHDDKKLCKMLDEFFLKVGKSERNSIAIVAPHAGYIYSGGIAVYSFAALKRAKTYFVLGPNHTGYGKVISIFPAGEWETPLGKIEIDEKLSKRVAKSLEIDFDEIAHISEHSIEVQLPFLQYCFSNFKIVAITIGEHDLDQLRRLGNAIFEASKGDDIAIIASSDFTHYENAESAKQKDLAAINMIEKIDIDGFYKMVISKRLSICGFAPIVVEMMFAKLAGLKKGILLKYGNSGDITGDKNSVVGYAAIKIV